MKADPNVEIRDESKTYSMRVREVADSAERQRLRDIAVAAFPSYQGVEARTIPVFIAEPIDEMVNDRSFATSPASARKSNGK